MKKQARKEIEQALAEMIGKHLSAHDPSATGEIKKIISSAAKTLAKKFAKAVKRSEKKKAKERTKKRPASKK